MGYRIQNTGGLPPMGQKLLLDPSPPEEYDVTGFANRQKLDPAYRPDSAVTSLTHGPYEGAGRGSYILPNQPKTGYIPR